MLQNQFTDKHSFNEPPKLLASVMPLARFTPVRLLQIALIPQLQTGMEGYVIQLMRAGFTGTQNLVEFAGHRKARFARQRPCVLRGVQD
jgi:hypothetical protein